MSKCYYYQGHASMGSYVASRLEPLGWTCADGVAEASVVLTYCTSSTALEDAYFGEEGFVRTAPKGTLFIDLSPSTPAFSRELSAVATVSDYRPVEAPLSVIDPARPHALSPDNIRCFAAGEEDDVAESLPILGALANGVEKTGGFGTAQIAKAACSAQTATLVLSAAEADALRLACGAAGFVSDADDLAFPLLGGIAKSVNACTASGSYAGDFTVEMLLADVAAALTCADDVELVLPQLESAFHMLEVTAVVGGADLSPAALSLAYQGEEEGARAGLDWKRADGLYADFGGEEHGDDGFAEYDVFGENAGEDVFYDD